jgi:hypothetical protein
LSFLWVSLSISHRFSASILARNMKSWGGVGIDVDTLLSTLGTHFILYLRLSSRRLQDDTGKFTRGLKNTIPALKHPACCKTPLNSLSAMVAYV